MPSSGSTIRKRGSFTCIRRWPTSPECSHLSTIFIAIRKGRGEPREHPDDARGFFDDVARRLDGIDSVLIVGPASAKNKFITFVHEKHPQLVSKVVGVEAADHPTGREIVAHARTYFKASDRMGGVGAEP